VLEAQPSAPNVAPPVGLMGSVGSSADAGRITPMASASGLDLFAEFENDNTLFSSFIPSDWPDPQVQGLQLEYAVNPSSPSSASTSSLPYSSAQVSPASFMQDLQEQDAFQFEASASDNHHAYINPSAVFMAAQVSQEQAWQSVVSQPVSEPAFVPVQYALPVYEAAQQTSPMLLPLALSEQSLESEDTQVSRANKTDGIAPSRRSGRKTTSHHHPYRQGQDTSEDESEEESRSGSVKKPFACNVCGTRFCRDFERVRHMKAHNNQNLNCGICNKTIKNGRKDALRRHQLRTRKCVAKQVGLSDDELVLRGCVTSLDRAQWESRTKSAGDEDDE